MVMVMVIIVPIPWPLPPDPRAVRGRWGVALHGSIMGLLLVLVPPILVGGAILGVVSAATVLPVPGVVISRLHLVIPLMRGGRVIGGEVDGPGVWQCPALVRTNRPMSRVVWIFCITGAIVIVVTRILTIATVIAVVMVMPVSTVIAVVVKASVVMVVVPGGPHVMSPSPAVSTPLAGAGLGGAHAGGGVAGVVVQLVSRSEYGTVQPHGYPVIPLPWMQNWVTPTFLTCR